MAASTSLETLHPRHDITGEHTSARGRPHDIWPGSRNVGPAGFAGRPRFGCLEESREHQPRRTGRCRRATCSIASLTSWRWRSSYSTESARGGAARRPPRDRGACRRSSRGPRVRRARSRRSGSPGGSPRAGRRRRACRRAPATGRPARTARANRRRDRGVGAAEALDRRHGSSSAALTTCSAPSSRAVSSRASLTSTATTEAPVIRAYWTARWPRPPTPKTATRSDDRAPETFTAL